MNETHFIFIHLFIYFIYFFLVKILQHSRCYMFCQYRSNNKRASMLYMKKRRKKEQRMGIKKSKESVKSVELKRMNGIEIKRKERKDLKSSVRIGICTHKTENVHIIRFTLSFSSFLNPPPYLFAVLLFFFHTNLSLLHSMHSFTLFIFPLWIRFEIKQT